MKNFYDYLEDVQNEKETYQEGFISGLVNKGIIKLADYVIKSEEQAEKKLKEAEVYTNYINTKEDQMKFIEFANQVNYTKKFKTENSIKEELVKRFPYLKDHSFKQILLMLKPENIELLKQYLRKGQHQETFFKVMEKTSSNLINLLTFADQTSFTMPQDKIIDFFNQFGKIIKDTRLIKNKDGRISEDILKNIEEQINNKKSTIQEYLKKYVEQNVPEIISSKELFNVKKNLLKKLENFNNRTIGLYLSGDDKDKLIGISFK